MPPTLIACVGYPWEDKNITVIPGTVTTRKYPILAALTGIVAPCSQYSSDGVSDPGIIGDIPSDYTVTVSETFGSDNPDIVVSATTVALPSEDRWELHVTVDSTAVVFPPQSTTSISYLVHAAGGTSLPDPTFSGGFTPDVFVTSVYEDVGYFTFPNTDEGFYIDNKCRATAETLVDFSSSGNARYRIVLAGKLSQEAIAWQDAGNTINSNEAVIKVYTADSIVYFNVVPVVPFSINGVANWFRDHGDPFCYSHTWVTAATTTNITVGSSGSPPTVDTINLKVGDRVLVKNQTNAAQNGIWVVNNVSTGNWSRYNFGGVATLSNASVYVENVVQTATQRNTSWTTPIINPLNVGTTPINWRVSRATDIRVAGYYSATSPFPYYPVDLKAFQGVASSSYAPNPSNITSANLASVSGDIYTNAAKTSWRGPNFAMGTMPFVLSAIATDVGGFDTVGDRTYDLWAGPTATVTVLPGVANDVEWAGSSRANIIDMEISENSGAWIPLATTARYSVNLVQPAKTFTPSFDYDGNTYYKGTLTFTALQAGVYKLRVRPTADANPNVKSTQQIVINASQPPTASLTYGTITPSNNAFDVVLTASCSMSSGTYAVSISNTGAYNVSAGGPHDDIELRSSNGSVLIGKLSSSGSVSGIAPGTSTYVIRVPAYLATKLTSQSFAGIFKLTATSGSLSQTFTGGTFAYNRPATGITVASSPSTIDFSGSTCVPGATKSITKVVSWTNQIVGSTINLSVTVPSNAADFSLNKYTITNIPESGSDSITITFTQPSPIITSSITGCTLNASIGSGGASTGGFQVIPCGGGTTTITIQDYSTSDRGLLFPPVSSTGAIGAQTYFNKGPSSWDTTTLTDGNYSSQAYFKLRDLSGNPDTSTNYTVEVSTSSSFDANVITVPAPTRPDGERSATSGIITVSSSVRPYQRGAYAAGETAIRITVTGADATNAFPILYIRVKNSSGVASTNMKQVNLFPLPLLTDVTGKTISGSATLYLETGAGMLLSPEVRGTPTPNTTSRYFGSGGTFTLSGSSTLFVNAGQEVAYVSNTATTQKYTWWETVGSNTGDFNVYIQYGPTIIFTLPCKVVTKSSAIDLRLKGATTAAMGTGETATLTYNNSLVVNYAFNTAKSTGFIGTTVTSGTPTITIASNETASFVYGVLTSNTADPNFVLCSTCITVVAVKAIVSGAACQLTSTSTFLLLPAVTGTCYPPYIPGLNGLKLPNSILIGSVSTPVTDWTFGDVTINAGADSIKVSDKILGYPVSAPTAFRFEIISEGGYYKLRTLSNGNLSAGSLSVPKDITMALKATVSSGGCASFSKTITVSSEGCTVTPLIDVGTTNPMYSCDVFLRTNPDSGGGNGYETSTSGLSIHTFIEDGFAVDPSALLSRYGLKVEGTKLATGAVGSLVPVKHYTGVNLDNYALYATYYTNSGVPSCAKKVYKLNYYKNYSPKSAWLPIPSKFFIGTNTTPLTSVPNLYIGDILSVQLQEGISTLLEAQLEDPTKYKLVFTPTSAGPPEVALTISYTSAAESGFPARRIDYTIPPGGGGLVANTTYVVSVVNQATQCAYNFYNASLSPTVGTVKYIGTSPTTSPVTFNTVPPLDPCFQSVVVTGNGTAGLDNIRTVTLFETATPAIPIASWTNLAATTSTSSFTFTLPRNNTAFPTTRTSNIGKSFLVQLYNSSGVALLATQATLILTLKDPVFSISQSSSDVYPAVGTPTHDFVNILTVSSKNNTCCSACSSGTCTPDDLTTATILWAVPTKPSWLAIEGPTNTTQLQLWNNAPIPSDPPQPVSGSATVTYYNRTWTVLFSYTLSPTEAFIVSTDTLPSAKNGTVGYTASISTSNKPGTSCATLTWVITDRRSSGTRDLPAEVTLSASGVDASKGIISWPLVADAGATFPYTYSFKVRASCNGGNPAATAEKEILLTIETSDPDATSITPNIGYFDIVNEPVLILGRDFSSDATVVFGNQPATDVVVSNDGTEIVCVPPTVADLGGPDLVVDVVIRNGDSGSVTLWDGYSYVRQRAPILLGISPSSGTPLGGTKVLLTGANFEPTSSVFIDGVEQPIIAITPSSILFVTYPHGVGDANVVVSNSNCGGTLSICPSIKYTFRVSPQILAVSPFNISATTQGSVFITGTGFYAEGTVQPRVKIDNFEIPSELVVYRVV